MNGEFIMTEGSKKPCISIIIPIYNVEQYLPKCLDSLLGQTYKNLEIICVNDGSPDHSQEIVNQYAEKDTRVKSVSKENGGLSSARNYGHKFVHGKYLMYLDSDDWIDPETCEKAVQIAEKYQTDVVFWNYIREFENASRPRHIMGESEKIFFKREETVQLQRRFVGLIGEELRHPESADSLNTAWGKLYRADIIVGHQIYFTDTWIIGTEDAFFNLQVFEYVEKAVYLPECFSHYRRTNENSLTQNYNPELYSRWKIRYSYIQKYLEEHQCGPIFWEALDNHISLGIIGLGLNVLWGKGQVPQIRTIREIISTEQYRSAVKKLQIKKMPIHWRVFFVAAKLHAAIVVYLLLHFMMKLKE